MCFDIWNRLGMVHDCDDRRLDRTTFSSSTV